MWVRWIWSRVLRKATLWQAQSEEDARRLVAMGAPAEDVSVGGNLKYDVRATKQSRIAELIKEAAAGRPIVVAGSTVARTSNATLSEDEMFLQAMWQNDGYFLVLAPRHPERFDEVRTEAIVTALRTVANASEFTDDHAAKKILHNKHVDAVMLDTIGDLAAVYGVADVAFVGGSLVRRGGHNPLEPAQFGVPVVMGPSYENFRGIVGQMLAADAIRIVKDADELRTTVSELLTHHEAAKAMGERGRRVFEEQQGATARAVEAILGLVKL
jgi:3-deoxy-D-manno-octulosonic-acid transferase